MTQQGCSEFSPNEPVPNGLAARFVSLLRGCACCFADQRSLDNAIEAARGLICSSHPHTLSSALCALGRQDRDWSSFYRFFSRSPWEASALFERVLALCLERSAESGRVVVALDDTQIPKAGKKIPGVCILHNPQGLKYVRTLHRAQRYLCASFLLKRAHGPDRRGIPVAFEPAPPAKKPRRKASPAEWAAYRKQARAQSLCTRAVGLLEWLQGRVTQTVVGVVDGSFVNSNVLGHLPERVVLAGRTRKDLRLYAIAGVQPATGRRRVYGERLPSPGQLRQDESVRWLSCRVWVSGRWHELEYKDSGPVLWKTGAARRPVRILVVRPLSYRLRKGSKLLYRDPAYLLVSDVSYAATTALQDYVSRWEIEVNHRDEKSELGVGQAQVWSKHSAFRTPQFGVMCCVKLACSPGYARVGAHLWLWRAPAVAN